jgi:hypothetical protein
LSEKKAIKEQVIGIFIYKRFKMDGDAIVAVVLIPILFVLVTLYGLYTCKRAAKIEPRYEII